MQHREKERARENQGQSGKLINRDSYTHTFIHLHLHFDMVVTLKCMIISTYKPCSSCHKFCYSRLETPWKAQLRSVACRRALAAPLWEHVGFSSAEREGRVKHYTSLWSTKRFSRLVGKAPQRQGWWKGPRGGCWRARQQLFSPRTNHNKWAWFLREVTEMSVGWHRHSLARRRGRKTLIHWQQIILNGKRERRWGDY